MISDVEERLLTMDGLIYNTMTYLDELTSLLSANLVDSNTNLQDMLVIEFVSFIVIFVSLIIIG